MKLTLLHLLTGISIAAWIFVFIQSPEGQRVAIVISTIFLVLLSLLIVAFTSKVDPKTGALRFEDNLLFQALKPTYKLTIGFGLLTVLLLILIGVWILVVCMGFLISY
ncbi:MAG: hypothetical protein AAGA30_07325 [Planctomycetota bacterium]